MLYFLFKLMRCFIELALVFDYCKRYYKPQMINLMMDISYKLLYIYSLMEIFLYKMAAVTNIALYMKYVKEYTNQTNSLDKYSYVKDGCLIVQDNPIKVPQHYDFVIYTDMKFDENLTVTNNMKIIHEGELMSPSYEVSNVRFILIEININDSTYKIDLQRGEQFNFYVVGNRLDKKFFQYYLNRYILTDNTIAAVNMKLKIIDHEVNMLELDFTKNHDAIIFAKDSYMLEVNEK